LDRYYESLLSVDRGSVQEAVNRMAPQPAQNLDWFIERFCEAEFLRDYAEDRTLLWRLNQVLRRVGLPVLPEEFTTTIAAARESVTPEADRLIVGFYQAVPDRKS
jgi:hypothetical protein